MQCPNCGSNRIVDDSPVFMPVKAVKCQMCGWRQEIGTFEPKPIPPKGKHLEAVAKKVERKSLAARRAEL